MDINPAGPLHYMSLSVPCLSCARFVPVLNQNVYVGLSIGVSTSAKWTCQSNTAMEFFAIVKLPGE